MILFFIITIIIASLFMVIIHTNTIIIIVIPLPGPGWSHGTMTHLQWIATDPSPSCAAAVETAGRGTPGPIPKTGHCLGVLGQKPVEPCRLYEIAGKMNIFITSSPQNRLNVYILFCAYIYIYMYVCMYMYIYLCVCACNNSNSKNDNNSNNNKMK